MATPAEDTAALVLAVLQKANGPLLAQTIGRRLGARYPVVVVNEALLRLLERELVTFMDGRWQACGTSSAAADDQDEGRRHAARILSDMLTQYGSDLCEDVRRCRGLLNDLCPERPGERSVLIAALEEGVPRDLRARSSGEPRELLVARLGERLVASRLYPASVARWAVESWADALGVG